MLRTRFAILLILVLSLFLPGTASAREGGRDAGEYLILTAQYGTERHHVDVTERLKEGARKDRLFRVMNGVFGVDPDPGVVKTLRIFALGPDDQERMFEFREYSTVDGAMFRGWGRGEWARGNQRWSGRWHGNANPNTNARTDEGEFTILTAQYGTERRHVDVTGRLRDLARSDRPFTVDNAVVGSQVLFIPPSNMTLYPWSKSRFSLAGDR